MAVKKRGWFLVVLALLLLIFISINVQAEQEGCYVYPRASEDVYCVRSVLDTDAQRDCDTHADCSMAEYFIPGSDCSALSECDEITCNVDCQTHARGKCTQLGGIAISAEEIDFWCNPGCCKFPLSTGRSFCQFNLNKFQCELRAQQNGVLISQVNFDNAAGMNLDSCNRLYCQLAIISSNLNILVKDNSGAGVSGATLTLEGENKEATSDSSGRASFSDLSPKRYLISVAKSGYAPLSATISLPSNTTIHYNFTLTALGRAADVSGTVQNERAVPVDGVTISWSGPSRGTTFSDASGNYNIAGLPEGDYTFTSSKVGFISETKRVSLSAGSITLNFVINQSLFSGIRGITYLDQNNNRILEATQDRPTYGVRIYVDGVFRGNSQFSNGNFEISFEARGSENHTISASYQNYQSQPISFLIGPGQIISQNLLLTTYIGECSRGGNNSQKNVAVFLASHVPGSKEVHLSWSKPCPEVIGYTIEKYTNGTLIETFSASPAENSLMDTSVAWGGTYTYKIKATFDSGSQSATPTERTITLGNEQCEGKYHETTGWETFCYGESSATRKKVWTCNDANQLIESLNCGERDGGGENYYCARISLTSAECKNSGACSLQANPFGLYGSRSNCYGAIGSQGAQNYCYYDYTSSVMDQCQSCALVNNCFDYKGKDACEVNNCLGKSCRWIDGAHNNPLLQYNLILPTLVTPETGAGYCVENNYARDNKCSLCSPTATLFENYYCTAQVCAGLGNCFSAERLERCQACGKKPSREANCYTYNTEMECVGNRGIYKNSYGELTLSQDRCNWGRCSWNGYINGSGSCVKDSNGDTIDDCSAFADVGEFVACEMDNSPPRTKVLPEGINVISYAHPNLTFLGDDNFHGYANQRNKLGILGYCLTSASPTELDTCLGQNTFTEVSYPGRLPEETIAVNLINSIRLQSRSINGATYKVKFYSQDKYFNRENLQETFVYVDNVPPQFEINERNVTIGDTTTLTVFLESINEPMECTFALSQILPLGTAQSQTLARDVQDKQVTFNNLHGVRYTLNVSCKDDQENVNVKTKSYIFDLQQRIDIVYPALRGAVSSASIPFRIRTAVGASCGLYLTVTNEKVADFITDEVGKEHHTEPVSGFVEKEYAGEYKVICRELLTNDVLEDYFLFIVDFTPPTTQIVLREGARQDRPVGYGWEDSFVNSATTSFECTSEGFDCSDTYYCLGSGCEVLGSLNYLRYSREVSINQTTPICYYSNDIANNTVYQPLCGSILVEGYGITLERPELYYYSNEMWGISKTSTFDWQFFTRVPTSECGFDFTSGFNYATLPSFKIKPINSQGKYLFNDFPASVFTSYPESGGTKAVYVQCKNSAGELSPERKMNLEYDPTPPQILTAYADPNFVLEGISTNLFASTNDKTLCKFSDNSDSTGSTAYSTMEYSFPGVSDKTLLLSHNVSFMVGPVGDNGRKDYLLNVQCRNGAGDSSNLHSINFSVDYSAVGYIIPASLRPSGFVRGNLTLSLSTSKNARCEFKASPTTAYIAMAGAGGRTHSYSLGNLPEGNYKYLVRCAMGDHQADAIIEFTIDTTPPTITNIDDGNYTCGKDKILVMVYTNENKLSSYYYEIYDSGNVAGSAASSTSSVTSSSTTTATSTTSSTTSTAKNSVSKNATSSSTATSSSATAKSTSAGSASRNIILSGTVNSSVPIEILTSNLTMNHRYIVRVKAFDAASNEGAFKESDGILIVNQNYSACRADKIVPRIIFTKNESCTLTNVEMRCDDAVGCKEIKYGTYASSALCVPNKMYNGQKIPFDKSGWLCYSVNDYAGNNKTGSELISTSDYDGDGVMDKCDRCLNTPPGSLVDSYGCASNDVISENASLVASRGISTLNETKVGAAVPQKSYLVAWLLLVIGLLMILGGVGYLVYYYKYSPAAAGFGEKATPSDLRGAAGVAAAPQAKGMLESWKEKLVQLRKAREEKIKRKGRESVFGAFSKGSEEIPHIDKILAARASSIQKLQQAAQKYAEHKEEIQPGLKREEAKIFSKLEDIAEQTKSKKIHEVIGKEEAGDIFSKLKELSQKRKAKK